RPAGRPTNGFLPGGPAGLFGGEFYMPPVQVAPSKNPPPRLRLGALAMLRQLVHFSLQFRGVVVLAAATLIVTGVFVALRSPLDVFPEFAPPLVEVQAEAPGMSSEAVQRLLTIPPGRGR